MINRTSKNPPIYLAITSFNDETGEKPYHSQHAILTSSKKVFDEECKFVNDDIAAGATFKSLQTFVLDNIDIRDLWITTNPERDPE